MGCPIRKSQDQSSVTSSSGLIAGSSVLHRLSTPRHPPCALTLGRTNQVPRAFAPFSDRFTVIRQTWALTTTAKTAQCSGSTSHPIQDLAPGVLRRRARHLVHCRIPWQGIGLMRGSQPSFSSGAIKPLPDGAEREWFLFQLLVIRSELRSPASGLSTDLHGGGAHVHPVSGCQRSHAHPGRLGISESAVRSVVLSRPVEGVREV